MTDHPSNGDAKRKLPIGHQAARHLTFQVAESSKGSYAVLAGLRWSLVVVFLWFGAMKFTGYEAAGISPFIINSPLISWLDALFGVGGASAVVGVLELSTAAALIARAVFPIASALGAAMSCATYLITLSFFFSTPGVAEPTAGGFPAISAPIGQFLLKDLVLFAASLCLLIASLGHDRERWADHEDAEFLDCQ